jgi:hypothetical protein
MIAHVGGRITISNRELFARYSRQSILIDCYQFVEPLWLSPAYLLFQKRYFYSIRRVFYFLKRGKREVDRGPFKWTKYGFPSLSSEKGKK